MGQAAPATGTALLLLVVFVLPGFVTLVLRETTYVVREATTPFERLLLSLSYSVRIYGLLVIAAFIGGARAKDVSELYNGKRDLGTYIVVGALALVVLPLVISEVGRWWRRSARLRPAALRALRISKAHGTPSGWDHFFGSNTAALVRITLDDGRVVGGYFGEESLAAFPRKTQNLFLEERWELDGDGWFLRPAPSSLGLWLSHEHVISLEVYEPSPDQARPVSRVERISGLALAAVVIVHRLRGQRRSARQL